ncbi:ABC-type transport system, permease and ATPase components [Paracholeplasma brassicae]|uniref:ABC-type transport system, permease and ATPase components n=1 Tax=Acholeplasma brassicae TaxID=61635 RepID=U4KT89_9MOLU|nr:ABC transporter ATP-binding protein [Paracholeplasma brassicae]CCV66269.1 ABC-type transport system, permease and ATPase components [Paracholeplasma brassicae]
MKDFNETTIFKTDKQIVGRLLKYASPYKKNFIISLVLILVEVGISSLAPVLLGLIIRLIGSPIAYDDKIKYLVLIGVAFLAIIMMVSVVIYLQNWLLQTSGQKIVYNIRQEVFLHIQSLSNNQINSIPVGKLVTRVTNDTNTLSEMYTSVIVSLIRNTLLMITLYVIMLAIGFRVALMMALLFPFVVIATMIFRKVSRLSYRTVRNNVSEINAFLNENISGIKLTQIFNQEEKKMNEFKEKNRNLKKSYYKELLVFAIYRPIMFLFASLASILVLYLMTQEIIKSIAAGQSLIFVVAQISLLAMLYQYAKDVFEPVQQLAEQFNVLQSAMASAEKIFDVLDTTPEISDSEDAIELESFSGQIEFKNVWFKYVEDEWVLKDVSFKVNPNDTVAFVGATGSGKTTIMSLIVRNYEINQGQILIDGIDIKQIKRSSLRKFIGQMPQDVFLFTGSIKSNITLNDDSISQEEVIEAAKYVGADSFIDKLDDSYDHIVRERGNNFSTGQRQLLSFARAIVYKPSLMILDEATANIDSETESLIQTSLEKMMAVNTMLVVAHRLSTIQHADTIIVMQKGEIKEMGNHQALLKRKGLYYSLYQLQYE